MKRLRDPEEWYSDFSNLISSIREGEPTDVEKMEKLVNEGNDIMIRDSMTGLFNHATLYKILRDEVELTKKEGRPLCVIMSDVDNFGDYNKFYSHLQGDLALITVVDAIEDGTRETDELGRYGGEEFAVILPNTDLEGAVAVAERIRGNVENMVIESVTGFRRKEKKCYKEEKGYNKVTLTLGVAQYNDEAHRNNIDGLFMNADNALLRAKREGKNRVCVYQNVNFILKPT